MGSEIPIQDDGDDDDALERQQCTAAGGTWNSGRCNSNDDRQVQIPEPYNSGDEYDRRTWCNDAGYNWHSNTGTCTEG